ncbi:hypothetical protein O59_003837 [Cellvibrio sp. BR]|nr:hypothetical protein O59_003837 [Cellvibrio sp. BR]
MLSHPLKITAYSTAAAFKMPLAIRARGNCDYFSGANGWFL